MYRSVFDDPLLVLSMAWFYITGTFMIAWVAKEKGRGGFAWFMLALFVSPILCLWALMAIPDKPASRPAAAASHRSGVEELARAIEAQTRGDRSQ